MFERFTDRARRVVVLAQEEARLLGHDHIGTEHLLLALIHEGDGLAALALAGVGVGLEPARAVVEDVVAAGGGSPDAHMPFTDRARTALEMALTEALGLGHNYIGTEHLLLGVLRVDDSVAALVLARLNVDRDAVRAEALNGMTRAGAAIREGTEARPPVSETIEAEPPRCPRCRSGLPGQLGWRLLEATGDDTGEHVMLMLVYCRRCGATLSVLPGP